MKHCNVVTLFGLNVLFSSKRVKFIPRVRQRQINMNQINNILFSINYNASKKCKKSRIRRTHEWFARVKILELIHNLALFTYFLHTFHKSL